MADEFDRASELSEFFLEMNIKKQRQQNTETPKGIGVCLNCEGEIEGDGRWCCAECRDDWDKKEKQRRRNGNTK